MRGTDGGGGVGFSLMALALCGCASHPVDPPSVVAVADRGAPLRTHPSPSLALQAEQSNAGAMVVLDEVGDPLEVPVAGADAVLGSRPLAEELRDLDASIEARQASLSRDEEEVLEEFRNLAAVQLKEGLVTARETSSWGGQPAFPQANRGLFEQFVSAAKLVLGSGVNNAVTTRIRPTPAGWGLSFVPLKQFKQSSAADLTWLSYSYGQSLPVRAYVFRLTRSQAGATAQCTKTVAVWEDPTEQALSC